MKINCLLNSRFRFPVALSLVGALALVYLSVTHAQVVIDGFTTVKPYVVQITNDYTIKPLLSVGDRVPETNNRFGLYQMVGIPDGLGAHKGLNNNTVLYMNHELNKGTLSEPFVGGPLNRGAIVSRFVLDKDARVIAGDRAYDMIYLENSFLGPAPEVGNSTPDFSRFCSGSLAWEEAGFDRPIYFAGEESTGAGTFDGRGGLEVAIFDNELHTLPKLGRIPWENALAQPKPGVQTVLLLMEDGPSSPDSQLYMYVGQKERRGNELTPLRRNGLDNGKLYAFVSTTPGFNSEVTYQTGTIQGIWREIPNAEFLTDVQLEAASDAIGAFGFIRTEDGAFDKRDPNRYYFVTTGGSTGNQLGRAYQLDLNRENVTGPASLSIIYNADQIIAAGGDTALSPDNIDTSDRYLMIQEDGTAQSRPVMASKNRDGSIWRFNLNNNYAAARVVELDPPGRDGIPVLPGVWETSGIIDASMFYGRDSWLTVVQAHPPTAQPIPNTVEDGQLLLMRPVVPNRER
ncbi:MAG: DUF839 domain-containing protein [Acidobacteriota bacterium]|nr:DUF839 domain-containing protein [Acidobacteriota bacterium]